MYHQPEIKTKVLHRVPGKPPDKFLLQAVIGGAQKKPDNTTKREYKNKINQRQKG
jgi:hypothetical protein